MNNLTGNKSALGLDANVVAGLCYVANLVCSLGVVLSIITLVTDKTNKLARFHAAQSLLLTAANLVILLPGYLIAAAFVVMNTTITTLIATLLWIVLVVVGLGLLVFMILAAIKAFQGEIYKIPVIGDLADKWSN